MVNLISTESKWFFVFGNENRFVLDIINASKVLQDSGCAESNIFYFSDYVDVAKKFLEAHGYSSGQLYPLSSIKDKIQTFKNSAFVGCVVSSHGDIGGIENTIKPSELIQGINRIPGVTDGLLLLGQCYSGIFNCPKESGICVLGASNFYPSLSMRLPNISWSANVFIYYFFEWMGNPVDIDGDMECSVTDAYKYASYKTNMVIYNSKIEKSKSFQKWCLDKSAQIRGVVPSIESVAIEQQLNLDLQVYHNHQEPWIANPDAANRLILLNRTNSRTVR